MKPAEVELGQLWQQTMASGDVRIYVVVGDVLSDEGYCQAVLLDLERGSQRRVNSEKMTSSIWQSWRLFQP